MSSKQTLVRTNSLMTGFNVMALFMRTAVGLPGLGRISWPSSSSKDSVIRKRELRAL